ncbi:hypothetical protein ELR50_02765 [Pseudomonas citronellolis]|uniref:hypothetical protein n=1 Tax=Pseudomonas citronellolis TaxID=53408 RepID=UPI0022BA649D|nr:hypothetical protein [Pseudomonas citronellolis]WBG61856.1 hypothetical protein ELR50_02705 [Pseudomonas citronellolis]WBG61867.1 hypothetical protein ELR50_02765 [Pseudomonas citronellolis]
MRPLVKLSRLVGAQVCKVKGCRYHYANGCYDSWKAYACIRCGELDKPLDSLAPRPDYIDDEWDEYRDWAEVEEGERLYQLDTRWFACLPFPRWL